MKKLGKVRPEHVKKVARELIRLNPEKFNNDFQNNKEMVNALTHTSSVKLRNRVAGYITSLLSTSSSKEEEEESEEGEVKEQS